MNDYTKINQVAKKHGLKIADILKKGANGEIDLYVRSHIFLYKDPQSSIEGSWCSHVSGLIKSKKLQYLNSKIKNGSLSTYDAIRIFLKHYLMDKSLKGRYKLSPISVPKKNLTIHTSSSEMFEDIYMSNLDFKELHSTEITNSYENLSYFAVHQEDLQNLLREYKFWFDEMINNNSKKNDLVRLLMAYEEAHTENEPEILRNILSTYEEARKTYNKAYVQVWNFKPLTKSLIKSYKFPYTPFSMMVQIIYNSDEQMISDLRPIKSSDLWVSKHDVQKLI